MAEIIGTAQTNEGAVSVPASAGNADGGADQAREEYSDSEFTDTAQDSEEVAGKDGADGGKKAAENQSGQSDTRTEKERNSENARRRREAERKRELQAAREAAIIETLGGKNPYTGDPVTDSDDVKEYLLMRKIEQDGGDPIADYHKAAKEEARNAKKEAEAAIKTEEWYRNDRDAFRTKHPDVDVSELISDPMFRQYADGRVGTVPLAELYDGYQALAREFEKKSRKIASQMVANKKASPGALAGTGTQTSGFYTREQVARMSQKEVSEHYDDIRKSMAKWSSD